MARFLFMITAYIFCLPYILSPSLYRRPTGGDRYTKTLVKHFFLSHVRPPLSLSLFGYANKHHAIEGYSSCSFGITALYMHVFFSYVTLKNAMLLFYYLLVSRSIVKCFIAINIR